MSRSIILTVTALTIFATGPLSAAAAPEVRSPVDGQIVGEAGDPQCDPKEPCTKLRAEGWVPPGVTPFFVVGPVDASPRKWVQAAIGRIAASGTFSGLIRLGESNNGARQWFKVYIYACSAPDALKEDQVITEPPEGCEESEPVEVYRAR